MAAFKFIVCVKQVMLNEPEVFVSANVGIVMLSIVKLAAAVQPPAAVTITFVIPALKPEPTVWLADIVDGVGLHKTVYVGVADPGLNVKFKLTAFKVFVQVTCVKVGETMGRGFTTTVAKAV